MSTVSDYVRQQLLDPLRVSSLPKPYAQPWVVITHREVYAVEWCSCVYESGYDLHTLHLSKREAVKTMIQLANARWYEERAALLRVRSASRMIPLHTRAWRVRTVALLP